MKCPACGKTLEQKEGSDTTKSRHRKMVYSFSYLTCGAHAWQTSRQREEMFQKRDALKRGASKKQKTTP